MDNELKNEWLKKIGMMNGLALALKEIAPAYSIRATNIGADLYELLDRTEEEFKAKIPAQTKSL